MNRGVRSAARAGLVVLGLVGAVVAAPSPGAVAGEASVYPAAVTAESWYRGGAADRPAFPPCGIPAVGCAPVPDVTPPNQYPSGTLHVGVAASAEDSRTYLTLVSSSVPFDQDVVGGTLTLPVLTDADSGTVSPEKASLRACLVTAQVKDGVEGGVSGAPPADCKTASTARFTPAKGSTGPFFTIDLAPFASAFAIGEVSLALVPGEQPGTAWHTAFSRSDRKAGADRPISAQVRAGAADGAPEPSSVSDDGLVADPPALAGGSADVPAITPGLADAPLSAVQAPEPATVAPEASAPAPRLLARRVSALRKSDPPTIVLLFPIVLVGVGTWVARVFTRELLQVRG